MLLLFDAIDGIQAWSKIKQCETKNIKKRNRNQKKIKKYDAFEKKGSQTKIWCC